MYNISTHQPIYNKPVCTHTVATNGRCLCAANSWLLRLSSTRFSFPYTQIEIKHSTSSHTHLTLINIQHRPRTINSCSSHPPRKNCLNCRIIWYQIETPSVWINIGDMKLEYLYLEFGFILCPLGCENIGDWFIVDQSLPFTEL